MSKKPNSLVKLNGVIRDIAKLNMTYADRIFRGAWKLTGTVVELDLEKMKSIAAEQIDANYSAALQEITKGYTAEEIATWHFKELAARAHKEENAQQYQTKMLQAEANLRGITVSELADRITTKADRFQMTSSFLTGDKALAKAQISAAQTPEAIKAVLARLV